ncbi:MAG: aldo/keto reductase [Chloroflexota bacterium]
MKTVKLGRTGLEISPLCLGTMTFGWSADKGTAFSILDAAVDAGITFFDTADIYSFWIDGNSGGESESIIGEWLKGKDRRHVVIATKVRGRMWPGANGEGLSRVHIIQAVEDSLRRLQTDHIDLYQTHWFDENTPLEETLSAFDTLVSSGKVRYIGASNHPAWRLTKSLWASNVHNYVRYESLQPHHSLLHRREFETELADLCMDQNMGVIPYSPLAAGFLTGKYTRENRHTDMTQKARGTARALLDNDAAFDVLDVVREIADGHGVPVAQVALAWQMSKPFITAPIIGARTVEQLTEVVGAVDVTLTDDEITRLDEVSDGF